jgi:hypothetical protein
VPVSVGLKYFCYWLLQFIRRTRQQFSVTLLDESARRDDVL